MGLFVLNTLRISQLFFGVILSCPEVFRFWIYQSMIVLLFILIILIISILVFIWARFYIIQSSRATFFFVVLGLFVFSIFCLGISERVFIIFIGWEGLGVTSFLLIIFYQNWSSLSGGLITLLTNRIGDAFLIIGVCMLLINSVINLSLKSILIFLLMLITALTKRAQIPFISWLPAAMAAPTPVRALVHSSTLVTAGIWLMLRFQQLTFLCSYIWLVLGFITLLVASLAALVEVDGKKIVALSTLSQLGLIFIALALGNSFICLMHVIIHALAKANLFLVVGRIIHVNYSQQDSRWLSLSQDKIRLFLMLISILSLRGTAFYTGFYRKETILIRNIRSINSFLLILILTCVITLTLSYCVKLLLRLFNFQKPISYIGNRFLSIISRILLGTQIIFVGFLSLFNIKRLFWLNRNSSLLWIFLLISIPLLVLGFSKNGVFLKLFILQLKIIFTIVKIFIKRNKLNIHIVSSTLLEPLYLTIRNGISSFLQGQKSRNIVIALLIICFYFIL